MGGMSGSKGSVAASSDMLRRVTKPYSETRPQTQAQSLLRYGSQQATAQSTAANTSIDLAQPAAGGGGYG